MQEQLPPGVGGASPSRTPLAAFAELLRSDTSSLPFEGEAAEPALRAGVQLILGSTKHLQEIQHKKAAGDRQLELAIPGYDAFTQHVVYAKLPADLSLVPGINGSSSSSSSSSEPYLSYRGFKSTNHLGSKLVPKDYLRVQLRDGTAAVLSFNYSNNRLSADKGGGPQPVPGMPGVFYLRIPGECKLQLKDISKAEAAAKSIRAAKTAKDTAAISAAEAEAATAVLWEGVLRVRSLAVFRSGPRLAVQSCKRLTGSGRTRSARSAVLRASYGQQACGWPALLCMWRRGQGRSSHSCCRCWTGRC
jgi:hypothetical protein